MKRFTALSLGTALPVDTHLKDKYKHTHRTVETCLEIRLRAHAGSGCHRPKRCSGGNGLGTHRTRFTWPRPFLLRPWLRRLTVMLNEAGLQHEEKGARGRTVSD